MSDVKPATDENRAAWTGTAAGWLDGPIPRNEEVAASDVMYLAAAVLCLDARIEAERTRAEEAEALLRVSSGLLVVALQGEIVNFESIGKPNIADQYRVILARIKAHLQEHTDGE